MEEEFVNKKIVILNGSPREKGNTAALVNAFSKGAEEAGNTVRIFRLGKMEIHGCKGCFGGKNEEEYPCVYDLRKDLLAQICSRFISR